MDWKKNFSDERSEFLIKSEVLLDVESTTPAIRPLDLLLFVFKKCVFKFNFVKNV